MASIKLLPVKMEGKKREFLIQAQLHQPVAAGTTSYSQKVYSSCSHASHHASGLAPPSTSHSPPTHSTGVIITHGAGGGMDSPHMQRYAVGLAQRGILCISFECRGPSLGHRSDVYEAVLANTRVWPETREVSGWFLAGHSMV